MTLSLTDPFPAGYDYDNIGNRLTAGSGGDTSGANLRTTSYSVNSLDEYTSVATPGYMPVLGDALAYNSVTVNGGTADRKLEYFHNEINVANGSGPLWQTVSATSGSATASGGVAFPASSQTLTYDADANLTFDGTWTYEWDPENRLAAMSMTNLSGIANSNRLRLEFIYDYLGRRVSKTVKSWNGSGFSDPLTTLFAYDAWNVAMTLAPGLNPVTSFVWGLDLGGTMDKAGGVGGLLMCTFNGSSFTNCFAGYSGSGNVTALLDGTGGAIQARYDYGPFGTLIRSTGRLCKQNPFRFSTKFWDQESGLIYYNYRFYSPGMGRWISRDPSQERGGNNLLGFCVNNPSGKIDTNGRITVGPEDDFSFWLNDMADWYELAARAQVVGDSAAFRTAHMFANLAAKNAMKAVVAEEGGAAAAGAAEGGFASAELLGSMGAVAGGVAIGVGGGLVFAYVVDRASDAVGAMIKEVSDANCAIIDYWADPNTK
jgi:RHS repeat-associated protein